MVPAQTEMLKWLMLGASEQGQIEYFKQWSNLARKRRAGEDVRRRWGGALRKPPTVINSLPGRTRCSKS